MCKSGVQNFLILNVLAVVLLLTGCGGGGSGSSSPTDTKADLVKDFSSNKAGSALKSSVIAIPDNLQLTGDASAGKKSKAFKFNKSNSNDSIAIDLYGVIRYSVEFSNDVIKSIESFLSDILDSQILVTSETGVIIPIEDEESDVTAYMIEDVSGVSGENYKWKLSLYFNDSLTPDMIFRFTFKNESMKGQMLANIKNTQSFEINSNISKVDKISVVDVRFDGTENLKKLDVDFTTDLTSVLAFAENNKEVLTEDQIASLDVGQAGKFSLRVQYDGTEYGISGCGYAPGSDLKREFDGEDDFFGEGHSTFTFRAKSITGEVDGAKMDVALPINTLDNVNSLWETYSLSKVFQEKLLTFMNSHLSKLIDETDGQEEENNDDFAGSTLEEQRIGFYSLYWFFEENLEIPTFAEHGNVISTSEFDNAVSFWGIESFTNNNIVTVEDLNAILASTDEAITEAAKTGLYYHVMAPVVIAYYQANPVELTIPDIEAILDKTDDLESSEFRTLIETIKHLVNPAFFEKENGFLGTFDGENFYTYDSETNSLALGAKPSNFDVLNALDLTELEAIIPNDVYTMVIEVK